MADNISRRNFFKLGGKDLANFGMNFLPSILKPIVKKEEEAAAQAAPPPPKSISQGTLKQYFTHFGVTEAFLAQLMSEALSRGGDYCDLFFQHTISHYVGIEDKIVNRALSEIGLGVGIRVIKGEQTGYSFTEELTPEAMMAAARTAANIANVPQISPAPIFVQHKPMNYYPIVKSWEDTSIGEKIPKLQYLHDMAYAYSPFICTVNVTLRDETSYILFANSEGVVTYDFQPMGTFSVHTVAEKDGRRERNGCTFSGRLGFEYFTLEKLEEAAKEAVQKTLRLFEAVKPEAGEMEVVLAAGDSGILLHEAIGHGMEADFNRKDISIFSDKIGKPVAESIVTIVDNGTNPGLRGSINVDDEGNETQCTYLVENGIMNSYLHDRISAKFYKVNPTGSGRRESFRHIPMPRMRNTYMLPGPDTPEEIIASVKKGIYAESFTNGQVNIGAGDFTFYVDSGYLIENGKLTRPIKDVNIIGNGPQVLRDIVMVGNDLKMSEGGWTCGKSGQGVPVSLGLPTVKVAKITVGGIS